jgi:hypothetical protein
MGEVTYRGQEYWRDVKAMRYLPEGEKRNGWTRTVIAMKEGKCTDPLIKSRYMRVIYKAA